MVAQTVLVRLCVLRLVNRLESSARTVRTERRDGKKRDEVEEKQKSDGASAGRTIVRGESRVRSEDG